MGAIGACTVSPPAFRALLQPLPTSSLLAAESTSESLGSAAPFFLPQAEGLNEEAGIELASSRGAR